MTKKPAKILIHLRVLPETEINLRAYREATGASISWAVDAAVAAFLQREAETNLHYKAALEGKR